MVDSVEAPDATTVVFKLKFATSTFLPSLADPYAFIYEKKILDKDPHWYEKHVLGSGPFKFVSYDIGQSIKGERNPGLLPQGPALSRRLHRHLCRQAGGAGRRDPRRPRGDRVPRPAASRAINELKQALGDKITVQTSDWNCGNLITPNAQRKPFDDVRVRKALLLAIDQWHGAPALSKIANVHTVGGIVFPGSPLAATKAELRADGRLLAGYREVARRGTAAAEGSRAGKPAFRIAQPQRRPAVQIRRHLADRPVEQDRRHATQKVVPTGPWFAVDAQRRFRRGGRGQLQQHRQSGAGHAEISAARSVFVENYGGYSDPEEVDIYNKMLRETDFAKQRVLMRAYETRIVDTEAHEFPMLWWYRESRSGPTCMGWKIGPSHYINQDLSDIWLDKRRRVTALPLAGEVERARVRVIGSARAPPDTGEVTNACTDTSPNASSW